MLPKILRYEGPPLTIRNILFTLICLLIIPFVPLLLIIAGTYWVIRTTWLTILVWLQWYPQHKYMVFVYSNSPNWKEYIETQILPRISDHAVIMNWSERNQWKWTKRPLELKVFEHWTGVRHFLTSGKLKWDGENYNPVAITFLPFWHPKVFRFWQAFKDRKHGNEEPLKALQANLFHLLKQ